MTASPSSDGLAAASLRLADLNRQAVCGFVPEQVPAIAAAVVAAYLAAASSPDETAATHTCPMCSSPVAISGDDEEGTHYYAPAASTPDEPEDMGPFGKYDVPDRRMDDVPAHRIATRLPNVGLCPVCGRDECPGWAENTDEEPDPNADCLLESRLGKLLAIVVPAASAPDQAKAPSPGHTTHSEAFVHRIRAAAREHGYAIGVHGSQQRDLDLIAVPWVAEAAEPDVLVAAIRDRLGLVDSETSPDGNPATKPQGRLAWALNGCPAPWKYVDLSVVAPPGHTTHHDTLAAYGELSVPISAQEAADLARLAVLKSTPEYAWGTLTNIVERWRAALANTNPGTCAHEHTDVQEVLRGDVTTREVLICEDCCAQLDSREPRR